jgi:hypothetical protein
VLSGNVGIPGGGVNLTNWPWREIRSPELLAEAARTAPPADAASLAARPRADPREPTTGDHRTVHAKQIS